MARFLLDTRLDGAFMTDEQIASDIRNLLDRVHEHLETLVERGYQAYIYTPGGIPEIDGTSGMAPMPALSATKKEREVKL